ncbi:hypothetical protein JCM6882_002156 [Rhodosporidiobolus microsporus]
MTDSDAQHETKATPTPNDGRPEPVEDDGEGSATTSGQASTTGAELATRNEPAPFPSLLQLPNELLSGVVLDPSLSSSDRAALCLVSRRLRSIAQPHIAHSVAIELFEWRNHYSNFTLIDKRNRRRFVELARAPLGERVRHLAVRVEPQKIGAELPFANGELDEHNIPYREWLGTLLQQTTNVVRLLIDGESWKPLQATPLLTGRLFPHVIDLTLPSFGASLTPVFPKLRHLTVHGPDRTVWGLKGPKGPFPPLRLTSLRVVMGKNGLFDETTKGCLASLDLLDIPTAPFSRLYPHPDLSDLSSLRSVILRLDKIDHLSRRRFDTLSPPQRFRLPDSLLSLTIFSAKHARYHRIPSLPLDMFSGLPSSLTHLSLEVALFTPSNLFAILGEPAASSPLPGLEVFEAHPPSGETLDAAELWTEERREELRGVCRERGLKLVE